MILYHGTIAKFVSSIHKKVDTERNRGEERDFGHGFYLSDEDFARDWAMRIAAQYYSSSDIDDLLEKAVVIPFECDFTSLDHTEIFEKRHKTLSFGKLVFYHRVDPVNHDTMTEKVIKAPMADGRVDAVAGWYRDKPSFIREVIAIANYMIPSKHIQYVIKDQKVADNCIKMLRPYNLKGDEIYVE